MAHLKDQLIIRQLEVSDAPALSGLLCHQRQSYVSFFHPFDFDEAIITGILRERRQDVYEGIFWGGSLVGFFMLRGWDAGFAVPAYGVLIDEKFRGYGLAQISLRMAKIISTEKGAGRIMLKVERANVRAKAIFEKAHFTLAGTNTSADGMLLYYFDLHERRKKS